MCDYIYICIYLFNITVFICMDPLLSVQEVLTHILW